MRIQIAVLGQSIRILYAKRTRTFEVRGGSRGEMRKGMCEMNWVKAEQSLKRSWSGLVGHEIGRVEMKMQRMGPRMNSKRGWVLVGMLREKDGDLSSSKLYAKT